MNIKSLYPISVKLARDRQPLLHKVFEKLKPHKGIFIDVCLLESYEIEDVGVLFDSLEIGERLDVLRKESKYRSILAAVRADGSVVGEVSFKDSIVLNTLINHSIRLYAFVEAKEFNAGVPEVAVSVYCEDY